jgi:hypothetical protein
MKKEYSVRLTYTHRKYGPGEGRSVSVKAGNPTAALGRAAREFWSTLTHKERNDVRRGGLKAEVFVNRVV